ncbi:MAG: LysR family transcriptional regulator [Coxiellaceae bacterium]|nr:LysR family transcriptional regulator [Coxiellaceae bacterium]
MNISQFNFNLLRALDALISEQNVTRASKLLNITQSAMSSSLNQIRDVFEDELLVRCQHGMILTPRAQELSKQIKPIMQQINALTQGANHFNPKQSTRSFCIGMTDFACSILLERWLDFVKKEAPHIEIDVRPIDNSIDQANKLGDPSVELFLGFSGSVPKNFMQENIFEIDCIVVAKKGHPLMKKKISMKEYLEAEHLEITFAGHSGFSNTNAYLQIMGEQRNIRLSVPHTLVAIDILPHTNLLATMPEQALAAFGKNAPVDYQMMPFNFPIGFLSQIWHQRFDQDPAHQWLRDTLKLVATTAVKPANRSTS